MKKIFYILIFAAIAFPALTLAKKAIAKPLNPVDSFIFTYEDEKIPVDAKTLQSWFQPVKLPQKSNLIHEPLGSEKILKMYLTQSSRETNNTVSYSYSPRMVYEFIDTLANQVDTKTVEPQLTIENTRATNFIPPQDGLKLDVFQTTQNALQALAKSLKTTDLLVSATHPNTSLFELNTLGINELVGRGESNFKGSPNNRRHNIKVGIEKFKGVILKPGEEFSFNKFLGPVEKAAGFLPELVIKKTGTVPELGGGLCQVSTTTFRAAMQAGLPITARRNHAYAVQYYSPQGTDATIYPGSSDLKFINDTPGYLLIWPYEKDKNTLVFDFYGTKDDRLVTLEKPVAYDRKPDGSMKATWTREVFKNGTTTTDTFKSIYQSPALFHKEEIFVSIATSTPQNNLTPKTN